MKIEELRAKLQKGKTDDPELNGPIEGQSAKDYIGEKKIKPSEMSALIPVGGITFDAPRISGRVPEAKRFLELEMRIVLSAYDNFLPKQKTQLNKLVDTLNLVPGIKSVRITGHKAFYRRYSGRDRVLYINMDYDKIVTDRQLFDFVKFVINICIKAGLDESRFGDDSWLAGLLEMPQFLPINTASSLKPGVSVKEAMESIKQVGQSFPAALEASNVFKEFAETLKAIPVITELHEELLDDETKKIHNKIVGKGSSTKDKGLIKVRTSELLDPDEFYLIAGDEDED